MKWTKAAQGSLDGPMLILLALLAGCGMAVIHSAEGGADAGLLRSQELRLGIALAVLVVAAQLPVLWIRRLTPLLYGLTVLVLVIVDAIGVIGHGAQRWLDLGVLRFQPSELAKLSVPLMVALLVRERPLPMPWRTGFLGLAAIMVPVLLIAAQPDLGTALLVMAGGLAVLFLAGLPWALIGLLAAAALSAAPVLWYALHDYQRQRILTLLSPEQDPLGSGYHIIQAKIAIGSGGLWGKGWLQGTQAQLDFIPESSTDFVFAVFAEEFGLVGAASLLTLYALVIWRGALLARDASEPFTRLAAGGLVFVFFTYVWVNLGMVCGLLPVVGVPLPLLSFGGSALVTVGASFGVLMALTGQRKLLPG